jgi:hypothetical protein
MISPSDITFLFSGGASNSDPTKSLGGEPSAVPLTGQLLPDITTAQAQAGYTDYHCLYIVNDNSIDSLYGASVYIDDESSGGVPVALGFQFQDDTQQVTVANGVNVTGGSMTLQYEGTNFTVNWASSFSAWAANFQTAISALTNLTDVTVTGGINGSAFIFQVNFIGDAGNRFHDVLAVIDDSTLVGVPPGSVSVLKIFDGAPLNSIAPLVDATTTAPNGILFYTPSPTSQLLVGDIRGTDIVPVWIQRVCPPNMGPVAGDTFTLKISGTPFPN